MKNLYFTIFVLLLVSINTYSQIPSYVPTNGLVGYWPFNGNGNDLSQSANNLTTNGNVSYSTDRFGNTNSAALFDAQNEYFNKISPALPSGNASRSLSMWLYTSGVIANTNGECPFTYGDLVNGGCYKRFATLIKSTQNLWWNGKCNPISFNNPNFLKVWTNFILTYESSTNSISLYQNGQLILSQTISGGNNTTLGELRIGSGLDDLNPIGNIAQFDGKIDEVAFYDRVLTQQEITNLYNSCTNQIVTMNTVPNVVFKTSSAIQLVGNPSGGTFSGEAVVGTTFTPANATLGKKTISYNYTSPQGCSGNASQTTIVVDSVGNVCSTYDTLRIQVHFTAGLYANTTNTIKFYPNPTKDILFIDNGNFQAMNGYSVKIVSLAGAVVYNQPITSQHVQISMNQFGAKGLYIAQIIDANNAIIDSKKIVLE